MEDRKIYSYLRIRHIYGSEHNLDNCTLEVSVNFHYRKFQRGFRGISRNQREKVRLGRCFEYRKHSR